MLFLYGTDLKQLRKILAVYGLGSYNEKALPSALAKPFPVLRTITTHIKSALSMLRGLT